MCKCIFVCIYMIRTIPYHTTITTAMTNTHVRPPTTVSCPLLPLHRENLAGMSVKSETCELRLEKADTRVEVMRERLSKLETLVDLLMKERSK